MSIYVVRYGDLYKIGFSSDLAKRVRSIIAAIPGEAVFVGHMPGHTEVETHLHSVFQASRFSGEWFRQTPELEAFCGTILDHQMPEPFERVTGTRRTQAAAASKEAQAALRSYALKKWPSETHQVRIDLLAAELGWVRSRTFDFYHANKNAVLRSTEAAQLHALALWLAPELRDEPTMAGRADRVSDNEAPDLRPSAWDRIKADPMLARARQKLSAHELKLIIDHAQAAPAGKHSEKEMLAHMQTAFASVPRQPQKSDD